MEAELIEAPCDSSACIAMSHEKIPEISKVKKEPSQKEFIQTKKYNISYRAVHHGVVVGFVGG